MVDVNVQLAIAEAKQAGLLDSPIRMTQVLDSEGLRLIFHLANMKKIEWPQETEEETQVAEEPQAETPEATPEPEPKEITSDKKPAPKTKRTKKKES